MSNPIAHPNSLARQARELFVVHVGRALPDVVKACDGLMSELRDHHGSSAEVLGRMIDAGLDVAAQCRR